MGGGALEDLLIQHRVDLTLHGHHHSYQVCLRVLVSDRCVGCPCRSRAAKCAAAAGPGCDSTLLILQILLHIFTLTHHGSPCIPRRCSHTYRSTRPPTHSCTHTLAAHLPSCQGPLRGARARRRQRGAGAFSDRQRRRVAVNKRAADAGADLAGEPGLARCLQAAAGSLPCPHTQRTQRAMHSAQNTP